MITVGIHIPPGSDRRSKQPPVSTILLTDLFKLWTGFEPTDPALQMSLEEEVGKHIIEVKETKEADVVVGPDESGYMTQSKVPQAHWTTSLAHSHHTKDNTDEVVQKGQALTLEKGGVDPSFVALDSHFIEDIQREWSESEDAWEEVAGTGSSVIDSTDAAINAVAGGSLSVVETQAIEAIASDTIHGIAGTSASDPLKKTAAADDITSKFGHSSSTTGYKKLALLPRSADLPPPLPPMQQVKKAPVVNKPASSQRKLKSNKQAVPTEEKKSHFGLLDEGDSDSDSTNSSKGDDPATSGTSGTSDTPPTNTAPTTTSAYIPLNEGRCGPNLELYTYKCPICTLDNAIHEASVGGEVRCEACDTPHIIPSHTIRND